MKSLGPYLKDAQFWRNKSLCTQVVSPGSPENARSINVYWIVFWEVVVLNADEPLIRSSRSRPSTTINSHIITPSTAGALHPVVCPVSCQQWCNQKVFNILSLATLLGRLLRVSLLKWVSNLRPSVHKKFLRFAWNLVCRSRSMIDAWRYAVWPDPRSRSRVLERAKFDYFQRLSLPPFTMGAGK